MKILYSIHLYLPKHACGAERMLHDLAKFLMTKGHDVRVLLHQANHYKIKNPYEFEGVTVFPPDQKIIDGLMNWCDLVITHLDFTGTSVHLANRYKKPVVWFAHSDHHYQSIKDAIGKVSMVFNSEWVRKSLNYPHPSFVLTPPCNYRYYDVNEKPFESEYITLINLDYNKGGDILAKIAEAMPDRKFLAVEGSYSFDERGQHLTFPPNVTFMRNTPDALSIYRKTRILLMPSKYESWGRTATEAMCNGIPVICNRTAGLNENCGMAGIYVKDREDIAEWVSLIKKLDSEKEYNKASAKAKARSRELDPEKTLQQFNEWLLQRLTQ